MLLTNQQKSGIIHFVHRGVAQLVEYWSPKPWVVGSSPSAPAKKEATFGRQKLLLFLSIAKAMAYHHDTVVDIINNGKPLLYIISPFGLDTISQ